MDHQDILIIPVGRGVESVDARGLLDAGFRVLRARDVFDGLVLARRRSFPTVIVDIATGSARDTQVVRALGRAAPRARVIALTEPATGTRREELQKAGVSRFLSRPFEAAELAAALRSETGMRSPPRRVSEEDRAPVSVAKGRGLTPRGLELLKDWTQLLTRDLANIEELLTLTLDLPAKELRARRGSLLLFDDARRTLELRRVIGFPKDVDPRSIRIPSGEGIAGLVAKQGAPLLVENLADEKALPLTPDRSYFTNSLLSVPIRHGSRVLGVLNLTDKSDGSSFTEAERELVLALARQAGAFIENARLLKKMETLSIVDELTGLYNRRFFEQCLENETIRARRYKRFLTLALLDIDDFKRFNDTHGYLKGDELLRGVARILRKSFRKTDIVTRWGGEEFAILLPETEKPDPGRPSPALHFTERVRLAIEGETFAATSMTPAQITVSGGVATFPTDTSDKSDLLAKANAALKQAKTSGKNRVCVFGEDK